MDQSILTGVIATIILVFLVSYLRRIFTNESVETKPVINNSPLLKEKERPISLEVTNTPIESLKEEASNFKLYKELKFGKILQYKDLDEFWYYDPELDRVQFLTKELLNRILEWNDRNLKISNEQYELLVKVKGHASSRYTIYPKNITFPVKVKLKNGGELDFCIIEVSKSAPYKKYYENLLFFDEIEEIMESEYTLPYNFRVSSMNAREVSMSLYPFELKTFSDRHLRYDGETYFASFDDIKGNEIKEEVAFNGDIRGEFVGHSFEKATYIIADWDERCDNLYKEYYEFRKE